MAHPGPAVPHRTLRQRSLELNDPGKFEPDEFPPEPRHTPAEGPRVSQTPAPAQSTPFTIGGK